MIRLMKSFCFFIAAPYQISAQEKGNFELAERFTFGIIF